MKSIIWRTLFSFWGATVVILAVVVISNARVNQQRNEELYSVTAFDLTDDASRIFDVEGIDGVAQWLNNSEYFPPGITLYVLENNVRDILDREFPGFLWPSRQAPGRTTRGMGPLPPREQRKPTLFAPDGSFYTLIVGPEAQTRFGAFGLPSVQWLVLLTAVTATAVACLALTGPLRRRLLRLQSAAVSLAQGDLGARVNLKTSDEIGAVAQQFDRMAERIETMVRSRQELFRNVSHEIRSPLARIQVALALAEEKSGEGDENLERIHREAEGLECMMQQILDLVKLEDPSLDQALEDVDLVEVVSLVVDDARFESRTRNISVGWSPPEGGFSVRGLPDVLRSAVENVVRNAIAHTPEKTRVDVSLTALGGAAELRIRDHGAGVSDAELDRIFDPFYRRDSSKNGAGIGLAITRKVVSLMKGTAEAAIATSGGLLVTLKLPLA